MSFTSTILLLPGLGNSGEQHWQTYWEKKFNFTRVIQKEWETPVCSDWIGAIDSAMMQHDPAKVILVAHSLACSTVAFWAGKYHRSIKGALLVGPSDTEAETYIKGTTGFTPIPLKKLPFKSTVVASTDDYYVSLERAKLFAASWGSEFVTVGEKGHINSASNLEMWSEGLELLKKLDEN